MQPLQHTFFKNKYKKMQRNILIMNIPDSEHPFTTDYFSRTDEMTVKILVPKLIYSGHFTADPLFSGLQFYVQIYITLYNWPLYKTFFINVFFQWLPNYNMNILSANILPLGSFSPNTGLLTHFGVIALYCSTLEQVMEKN